MIKLVELLLLGCAMVSGDMDVANSELDLCKDVCADSFFLLPQIESVQNVCQRGCRIFNIVHLKDDHDLNSTKEECLQSCSDAYSPDTDECSACEIGCGAMLKKKETDFAIPLFVLEQDRSVVIVEPELEIVESDLILDPLMQNQIEIGYQIEYRIPEAKIQTMPMVVAYEVTRVETAGPAGGDWLDCASRNSGIPKWFLLLAITCAILVALVLSFTSERKLIVDDVESLIKGLDEEAEEAGALPQKKPEFHAETDKV